MGNRATSRRRPSGARHARVLKPVILNQAETPIPPWFRPSPARMRGATRWAMGLINQSINSLPPFNGMPRSFASCCEGLSGAGHRRGHPAWDSGTVAERVRAARGRSILLGRATAFATFCAGRIATSLLGSKPDIPRCARHVCSPRKRTFSEQV